MHYMIAIAVIGVIFVIYLLTRKEVPAAECAVDADCPEGYICVNGICVLGEPPPGKATLLITVVNEVGSPISSALLTLDGDTRHSSISGKCSFIDLDPGTYTGSCTKDSYKITKVTLNGSDILFTSDGKF